MFQCLTRLCRPLLLAVLLLGSAASSTTPAAAFLAPAFLGPAILLPLLLGLAPAAPARADEGGTLARIRQDGLIRLGYRESSIPFSYLDQDQQPVGYALDICLRVVESLRSELHLPRLATRLVPVTSSTRIPLMANGTIDLECGSTTNNRERQAQVAFTNSHFLTASRFVARKDLHLATLADLAGRTVVSTAGTTNIRQLNELNAARHLGITVLPARDHAEAFLMVETDRASAFVMDDILLASLVAGARDPSAWAISGEALSAPEPYGIMLRRDDPAFKAAVDRATAALFRSPEGATLYRKWFLAPIPPRGITLGVPMSAALAAAFAHPSDSPDPRSYTASSSL